MRCVLKISSSHQAVVRQLSGSYQVKDKKFSNVEPPAELISGITNQQVVKAHNYIKKKSQHMANW